MDLYDAGIFRKNMRTKKAEKIISSRIQKTIFVKSWMNCFLSRICALLESLKEKKPQACLGCGVSYDGFTLIELMVVVIIVSILASLAIPNFKAAREKTLDREAISALRLIKVAERQYRLANNAYWPGAATTNTDLAQINGNLSIVLNSSSWTYEVTGFAGAASFRSRAKRLGRNWTITNAVDDPACAGVCY